MRSSRGLLRERTTVHDGDAFGKIRGTEQACRDLDVAPVVTSRDHLIQIPLSVFRSLVRKA